MPEPHELEAALSRLALGVDWPRTPVLSPVVVRRLAQGRQPGIRSWALAAAVLVLAAATLLAYAPTRDAIAGWLNLHTGINRTTILPTPTPLPSGPLGQNLGLGSPTTLDRARSSVGWRLLVPGNLGRLDAVYLQKPPDGPSEGEVSFVYSARAGIRASSATGVGVLVTEARGRTDTNYFGKTIGDGTTLTLVSVGGHDGWWIAGQPHIFGFLDADGNTRFETLRLATNTLIIDDGGTIVRIEGDLTQAQAFAIANSLA